MSADGTSRGIVLFVCGAAMGAAVGFLAGTFVAKMLREADAAGGPVAPGKVPLTFDFKGLHAKPYGTGATVLGEAINAGAEPAAIRAYVTTRDAAGLVTATEECRIPPEGVLHPGESIPFERHMKGASPDDAIEIQYKRASPY